MLCVFLPLLPGFVEQKHISLCFNRTELVYFGKQTVNILPVVDTFFEFNFNETHELTTKVDCCHLLKQLQHLKLIGLGIKISSTRCRCTNFSTTENIFIVYTFYTKPHLVCLNCHFNVKPFH